MKLFQDQLYSSINCQTDPIELGEYENCSFNKCNFQNADFSNFKFIDCEFKDCDLSLIKIHRTVLRDVKFTACKMMGILYETASEFGLSVSFHESVLNNSSFYKVKLKKTKFEKCILKEVDFTDADLSESIFIESNLEAAIFDNTNLEKVDFRTAFNYNFDLNKNKVKKSIHSLEGTVTLLQNFGLIIKP